MDPETEQLIARGRKTIEKMEELQAEANLVKADLRRIVRKIETLEPDNPPEGIAFSTPHQRITPLSCLDFHPIILRLCHKAVWPAASLPTQDRLLPARL